MTWVVVGILAGGVLAHWTAWRLRIPVIVFLLAGGLIAGPITGALDPDKTFGNSLFPLVSMAVAIVLFEGSLGLGWKGVQEAGRTVWMLLTIGAALTLVGTALAARFILNADWDMAMLIACVLVVTGPTVVGPLVASLGLRGRLGSILVAEGTLIDPIGAILTVLAFRALYEAESGGELFRVLGSTVAVGFSIGIVAALILTFILGRFILPDELDSVATLAMVVSAFAAANHFADEAGLISVTVMGVIMARQQMAPVHRILEFNHALRTLLISGLFILLGARITPDTLRSLEWRNIVFLAAMVLIVRPISVAISTLRSGLGRRDRLFLAATAPRGIVAAAIASVFALKLQDSGHDNSQLLVSAVFTVIAGTVVLSGFAGRPLAKRLKVLGGERKTMVLLGASPFVVAFAESLEHHGAPVRLMELDRDALRLARMTGLTIYHGSILDERTWDSVGVHDAACFLAMTGNDELNTLAAREAAAVLGRRHVFQVAPARKEHERWWSLPVGTFARPLFAEGVKATTMRQHFDDGWRIRATPLTDQFGIDEYRERHPQAIALYTVDSKQRIELIAADVKRALSPGLTLVALTPPTADERPRHVTGEIPVTRQLP